MTTPKPSLLRRLSLAFGTFFDILGNADHVVVLGSAKATARDGSSAEWKYTQIFHVRDGKATEVWGMAENDAAVDPFLDSLPG